MIKIKKELTSLAEPNYKEFSSKLTPNINNILGVRLPILRRIAKRIAKNNYLEFFKQFNTTSFSKLLECLHQFFVTKEEHLKSDDIKFIKSYYDKFYDISKEYRIFAALIV